MKKYNIVLLFFTVLLLSSCSSDNSGTSTKESEPLKATGGDSNKNGGVIEAVFGTSEGTRSESSSISVNGYLWRASLDTISFLPLNTADPFGGVIITEWYTPPESPGERFKVNIYILDKALRADGLRVTVFRQRRTSGERWIEAKVNQKTGTDLENAILKRARQMRIKLGQ
ncbi:MAG: hypothetical protein CMM41_02385 [Rhodospirillaceae bacterium]|nr:hypothetical protein [Rhodospirillaceae bacterium]